MNLLKVIQKLQKYYLFFVYITSSWLVIEAVALLSERYDWYPIIFDAVLVLVFIGLVVMIISGITHRKKEMSKLRIMIVDDEKAIREIIVFNLSDCEHFELMAEAENGIEALEVLRKKNIDLALVDIEMPEMDGIQLIEVVKRIYPQIKIIVLTMFSDNYKIQELLKLGVDGYVQKDFLNEELELSINAVENGGVYYSQIIKSVISDSLKDLHHENADRKEYLHIEI